MNPKACVTTFMIGALLLLVGCGAHVVKQAATAEKQFALAQIEFDKEHWLKAIEGFQKVIFNFPGATVVDTAQYYLALSYFENKEYELAAVEFKRLISNYPRSLYIDEAQYMAGVCYLKNTPKHYALDQEDLKRAISSLQDFMIDNPDSPLIEEARSTIRQGMTKLARKQYKSGLFYLKILDYRAARIYFQNVVDDYTDTKYAALALFKLSEILYKESKLAEALAKFNDFKTIYPGSEMIPKVNEYIEKITVQLETVNASEES